MINDWPTSRVKNIGGKKKKKNNILLTREYIPPRYHVRWILFVYQCGGEAKRNQMFQQPREDGHFILFFSIYSSIITSEIIQ